MLLANLMSVIDEQPTKKRDYLLPGSILISALLISISLVYSAGKKSSNDNLNANLSGSVESLRPRSVTVNLRPVDANDHIRGNPEAPVKVVEYSDLECPFCQRFHPVMQQVLAVYGDKVAWVYRHYPIDELHSRARKEAEASECANELGGNDKFWVYVDRIFEISPANNRLDPAELPNIAEDIGLDRNKFETCLNSGKYAAKVAADVKDAEAAGARGTPYSVVLGKNGRKYVIPGALPFEDPDPNRPQVKPIIEAALK